MKKLFLILSLILANIFISVKSEACPPPRFKYDGQTEILSALLSDKIVRDKIIKLAGEDHGLKLLTAYSNGFIVTLTNKCEFKAEPVWATQDGLDCSYVSGFKIQNESCKP